ncbi:MAG: heavy-metal-associated domain-containing protein [Planctomycetaceae bacterium]
MRKWIGASAFAVATLAVVAGAAFAQGAAAEGAAIRSTTITVGEMCNGCVKRITAKLEPMEAVGAVRCDIPTKTVTVDPAKGRNLSPRALWEAMEAIGKTPQKLAGPSGTFTSKPEA